jgi:hypothetical protein
MERCDNLDNLDKHFVQPEQAPRRRAETPCIFDPKHLVIDLILITNMSRYYSFISLFRTSVFVKFSIQSRIRSGQSLSTITTILATTIKISGQQAKAEARMTGIACFKTSPLK